MRPWESVPAAGRLLEERVEDRGLRNAVSPAAESRATREHPT